MLLVPRLLWESHCEERPSAAHSRWDSWLWDDSVPMFNFGSHTARSGQEPHTPGGTEVASVDFGTFRRYHGLWVWLETGTRGLVRIRSGRFGDTVR